MYQSVNFCDFTHAFHRMGRKDQFSYEALIALFDYLEEIEDNMEEQVELDVIALCCEYREIYEDEEEYSQYIGDEADREDYIIATLSNSVLVVEG